MKGLALFLMFFVIGSQCAKGESEPCKELKEFGCTPWVTCYPTEGGWKYIKVKK